MTSILGIAGSLRKTSLNAALLRAAATLSPSDCRIEIASLRGIPLYDGDVESAQGVPAEVQKLKSDIVGADGLLIVTPEYNHSIPGVLKNAIDWISRPPGDIEQVFGGRPVGVIGATPGLRGTTFAQTALLPVLRVLGTRPYFGASLYVSGARDIFDESQALVDEATRGRLRSYIEGFAAFVSETGRH